MDRLVSVVIVIFTYVAVVIAACLVLPSSLTVLIGLAVLGLLSVLFAVLIWLRYEDE